MGNTPEFPVEDMLYVTTCVFHTPLPLPSPHPFALRIYAPLHPLACRFHNVVSPITPRALLSFLPHQALTKHPLASLPCFAHVVARVQSSDTLHFTHHFVRANSLSDSRPSPRSHRLFAHAHICSLLAEPGTLTVESGLAFVKDCTGLDCVGWKIPAASKPSSTSFQVSAGVTSVKVPLLQGGQRFTFTRAGKSVSATGAEGVNTTALSVNICNQQTFSGVLNINAK